ncbi:hypothetical protein [Streptomyces antibioticus]|uniref:hypothetical protein n=1 Tax=Streptomyces antibioticus TaxID=1890 RepID=UPI0033F8AAB4
MYTTLDGQKTFADGAWPWERPVARGRVTVSERLRRLWSLSVLTTALLAGGYAWLGSLIGEEPGAVAGAVIGLVMSGGLHMTVNRAVSGPRGRRPAAAHRRPGAR